MPFVRITLHEDTPVRRREQIGAGVHSALGSVAGVPATERFQVIEPRPAGQFVFDPSFGEAERERIVFIEITLVRGLSVDAKRRLYREIADRLRDGAGVRGDDVFVVLHENTLADWSQARGEANLLGPGPSA
jgi:phenylpyruvate tautomerase PptA (4-oxalocrotonate tautomerase family)